MNTPHIRFLGHNDGWKESLAKDLFQTYNIRNHPELPVLSATQDRGMVRRDEAGYKIAHDRNNECTYKVVKPGQFVIHLRSFQGGFAHSSIEGIVSPAYTIFGFKRPEEHCDYFWKYIFMSQAFIDRLSLITYGIRDGRSISFDEFANMSFQYPSYEEQVKIAEYLKRLENQIQLQKKKVEILEQAFEASIDNMFV